MPQRDPRNVPAEDLPWNDAPADTDVVPGTEEPDPAEVEGDEDDDAEVDVSHPPSPDVDARYRRDTLDERLAEEEPDRTLTEQDAEAGGIQAAESDDADVSLDLGEADDDGDDDLSAEDAAVHIRPEDRA
jgi:hypothetical protein